MKYERFNKRIKTNKVNLPLTKLVQAFRTRFEDKFSLFGLAVCCHPFYNIHLKQNNVKFKSLSLSVSLFLNTKWYLQSGLMFTKGGYIFGYICHNVMLHQINVLSDWQGTCVNY